MILFSVNVVQHVKIDQANEGIANRNKSQISTQQLAVAQPEGREVPTYLRPKRTRAWLPDGWSSAPRGVATRRAWRRPLGFALGPGGRPTSK